MAIGIERIHGKEMVQPPGPVAKNSEVFALWSPVTIDGSGFLAVISSSGEKVYGYCAEAFTAIATNQTGTAGTFQTTDATAARYSPRIIAPDNVDIWMDADQALTDTDIGAYHDVASVSSGVPTMNLAATTSGQFVVLALASQTNPSAEGDTDRVVLRAAELTTHAYAQA